jgi:hypothetical protein
MRKKPLGLPLELLKTVRCGKLSREELQRDAPPSANSSKL